MRDNFIITDDQVRFFNANGYLVVEDVINEEEVKAYIKIYDEFLDGTIDSGKNRADLGEGLGNSKQAENITQIMWPSDFVPDFFSMPYHQKALAVAKQLMGNDIEMDFDMLINKAPFSNTPTPWHQDAAYWINMPDKRAASCWLSLDSATKDNGCMWYVPGSHMKELRPHRFAGKEGGALQCDGTEAEGVFVELKAGSCVLHHGATLHYSRGNSTALNRRAFIVNFRPKSMIDLERSQGFDHGRDGNAADRKVRNETSKK
ncbi:MAG TPA: phytanoyl-CoA dioxygenase family protein [Panacibacter sp.]|nr:phytanoyl-CoA dioxygenase family protein [Panacibacter sp.]HNP44853.1 phytanoyl-CoA dioxygenase family protein [Panacibacter sp.]